MDAYKEKELVVVHPNKPGAGALVYGAVADAGVNIRAFCGYTAGRQAVLTMVTEDNAKAKRALKKAGVSVDQREVVCVIAPNRPSVFRDIARRLTDAGIEFDYAYAAAATKGKALIVLQTTDDRKTIRLLSK